MATCSGPPKKRSRKGVRYHMELNFANDDAKLGFLSRMERAKRQLASRGSPPLDNREVISRLLDRLDDIPPTRTQAEGLTGANSGDTQARAGHAVSMLEHSGIFTDSDSGSDQSLFVCEHKTFASLCSGLTQPCQCRSNALQVTKTLQKGHVLRVEFQCQACRRKRWWASSQTLGGKYIVNQKIVHAFTCAGILPSQYIHFSAHAELGTLGAWYIRSVYNSGGYLDVVNVCAKLSMSKAITEVKALPGYSTNGEWVITDARHDSTANAFHTTVPCLSGSTKRVLACSTLSRTEHSTAQTRELQCTKAVLPQVIEQELNVVEVAHDHQVQVKNYITEDLKLLNSYDTWHGTKNVAKQMKKVSTGTKNNLGKTWFTELSDKRKSTKVHLYYCMKNCTQSATHLRNSILNIVQHYQNQHTDCHQDSPCHRPQYSPSKIQLTSPAAIEAYEKALKETLIYRNAESYCRCRDTYWVESFNHQLLTYLPKRIHFGSKTFLMRMNLACMDWNENVCRASTSERLVQDQRRPDRRTAMKVLVKKTFNFVDDIWKAYVQQKVSDVREIDESESDEDQVDEDNELIDDGVPMMEEDVEETVDEAEEE